MQAGKRVVDGIGVGVDGEGGEIGVFPSILVHLAAHF
jgi:hypothetical protein